MAGVTLGFLKFVLGFDSIAFKKGMSEAERDLVKLQKGFQSTAAKITSLGKNLTIGLTAPLVAFGTLSFKAASDANELQSAFNVTFGNMSKEMNKWAEATGNAMHRSTQTMQTAANTFGIFFNTAVDPKKAAEMSKTFAVLAQDLGSFFNVDPGDAMEKLRAGLAGEAEPLRAFGVFLNDAAVQAEGLKLGLVKTGEKMTEQQKIVARYNLILEATKKAQGDVARTSDSTANQMVAFKESMEELQVTVGTKLLPVFTPLIKTLNDVLVWFTQLSPSTQDWVLKISGLLAILGPILVVLGNVVNAVAKMGPLVKALVGAWKLLGPALTIVRTAFLALAANPYFLGFAVAVGAIYLAWKNWDKIVAIVTNVYNAVKTWILDKLNKVWEGVKQKIDDVIGWFRGMWDAVVGHSYVPDMVDAIGEHMRRLDTEMVKPAKDATDKTKAMFQQLRDELQPILDRLFPEQARMLQFEKDLATIEQGAKSLGLTAEQTAEAVSRLRQELAMESIDQTEPVDSIFAPGALEGMRDEMTKGIGEVVPEMEKLGKQSDKTTAQVIEGFGQMAAGVIGDTKNMVATFKSGDILGGIQQFLEMILKVLNTLGQLGAISLPGASGAGSGGFGGGLAAGGPVVPGKTYVVGENGPEVFSTKRRGYIHPNGSGTAQARIMIVPSKYFDAVVDKRAADVAAPMAGQAAVMGVAGAEQRRYRQDRRTIP